MFFIIQVNIVNLICFSDVVEAQGEISRLQQELDNQRRECYGHLKAMQQLKVLFHIKLTLLQITTQDTITI